ncbi:MAG: DUF4124 domain-containing protein [Myxococcota bacterium]
MMRVRFALLSVILAGATAPAFGEIYHCTLADGTVTFTTDPSSCGGGARPHEPSGNVQTLKSEPIVAPPAPPPPAAAASAEDGQQVMWQRKRVDAERELAALEGGLDEFRQLVSWCNRGGDLTVENKYGLRQDYSCDDARVTYDRMSSRVVELRDYLGGGLDEECRRSGCLPGWIR